MSGLAAWEEDSFWSFLGQKERLEIRGVMQVGRVARGETLIEQGSPAQTLFIVEFGLFDVKRGGTDHRRNRRGSIHRRDRLFADEPRTASVVAARDFEVLELIARNSMP